MATMTKQKNEPVQKIELTKRVSRLKDRISRINSRIERGDPEKVTTLLKSELIMREAELNYKHLQLNLL